MSDLVNNAEVEEEFHEVAESDKTPVTIVTGFLGSGKTTLVNYILKEQNTWKICVVENEFGEVSIDNDLVKENLAAKEDIIMLDNGCVCCSVRGDLVRTFAMLASRRKDFDAIIIETTGLADPSPIIFTFNSNALVQDNYRIDSVVCLVDAKHVNLHLDEVRPDGNINEAEQQIAFADRILLNKLDLVSEEELEDVEDRIKSINAFATLIKTERSKAPLDKILNLNSFSLERLVEVDPTFMDEEEEEHDHGHVHDEHCNHGHDGDHGHVHDEHCKHDHGHGHDHHECKHPHHDAGHVHDEHCDHKEHSHDHHHHEEHCKHPHHDAGHVHDEHCDHKEHSHDHHHHECKHAHHDAGHVHDEHCDHKEHSHEHEHGHEHGHNHSGETPKKKRAKKVHNLSLVSSVGFTIAGLLDVALFNAFMSSLLQAKAADLFRTKGVLAFANQGDTKFVFQGVHEQINFGPSEKPFQPDEVRESKMVFIGKNLDTEYLKESLLSCCEDPASAKITVHKRA